MGDALDFWGNVSGFFWREMFPDFGECLWSWISGFLGSIAGYFWGHFWIFGAVGFLDLLRGESLEFEGKVWIFGEHFCTFMGSWTSGTFF